MAISYYPAIISRSSQQYNVCFLDLPDCICFGTTIEEAILAGEKALSAQLASIAEHGNVAPSPSNIEAATAFASSLSVERFLIRGERPGRAVRIRISIEKGILTQIDHVTKNRSRFFSDAACAKLTSVR